MTSGELARRLGISTSTLLDWERKGKISPNRSPGGWRIYDENDLVKMTQFLDMRKAERKA